MANGIKPTDFPAIVGGLTGTEELYTQTGGINEKFLVSDIKDYIIALVSGSTDEDWVINGSNVYNNTNNIGIGTDNPQYTLDVTGDTRLASTLGVLANVDDDSALISTPLGFGSVNGGLYVNDVTSQAYIYGIFGSAGSQVFTGILDANISTDLAKYVGSAEAVELDGGFVLHCASNDVSDRSTMWVREDGFDLFYFPESSNPNFDTAKVSADSNSFMIGVDDDNTIGTSSFTQAVVFTSGSVEVYASQTLVAEYFVTNGVVNYQPKVPQYPNDTVADNDANLSSGSAYTVVGSRDIRIKP
jgi:hypothetical protein